MVRKAANTHVAAPPAELLRAAITHSSIAVAVCDHDFAVQFFNPALGRLVDPAATPAPVFAHGIALLRSLGMGDVDGVMADIAVHGRWHGVVGRHAAAEAAPRAEVDVAIEPFGDAASAAGWLITAREHPGATPAPTERDRIALSTRLTPREREVMLALHAGATNKAIAQALEISPRTVEFHRARIMQRFAATSLVDLVRKVAADAGGLVEGARHDGNDQ
jgi:DNA-binding CsgD family transcriptional regulator